MLWKNSGSKIISVKMCLFFFLNHTPEVILKAILQLLFLFGHARHII